MKLFTGQSSSSTSSSIHKYPEMKEWEWTIHKTLEMIDGDTYVSIELPHKAREVIVLEVSRQDTHCKTLWIPDHKAVARPSPGHHLVRAWVIHHIKGLDQEWWRTHFMEPLHWPGNWIGWRATNFWCFFFHNIHCDYKSNDRTTKWLPCAKPMNLELKMVAK